MQGSLCYSTFFEVNSTKLFKCVPGQGHYSLYNIHTHSNGSYLLNAGEQYRDSLHILSKPEKTSYLYIITQIRKPSLGVSECTKSSTNDDVTKLESQPVSNPKHNGLGANVICEPIMSQIR